ncbi:Peptidoglycan/LPS O-acetylase OafA/YrhL, contains acyltransferase and SGNH-hydrolase domains [Paenibacillus sophorae]|uniref:Acyltransferase n=1 Tax=Paenibacillus sophorae TaxID=1333845 RepID=A0A1H8HAC5_9BACL|nr:acyltransferase [Paenibacillus sophorae]QWU14487.1 acyltransferase [Paenibacillus sophorae]SEN52984.1 Peptidoglycan/LPS O-acetylase OafA/YrhL, contains acyltransferase and SGNH-hydrolase domains [Paenibacillus sophorae]
MKYFNYKLISIYRTQLMGIAILWIVFFHSTINTSSVPIINTFKTIGYGGVDIFLMLSGLGLYFSCQKDNNVMRFYKRRLLRIIPTYMIVVFIICLLNWYVGEMSLTDVILNLTTLSFWVNSNKIFDWYVPAIFVLYLLTPVFMYYFKSKNKYISVAAAILIGLLITVAITPTPLSYLNIFTIRIPIFFTGFLVGYWIETGKKANFLHLIVYIVMAILGLTFLIVSMKYLSYEFLWNNGFFWYPFILITLPLCVFVATSLQAFSAFGMKKFIFLTFCGTHSLEIYLIHERVLNITAKISRNLSIDNFIYNVICILITFLMAFLLKKSVASFTSKFTRNIRSRKAA